MKTFTAIILLLNLILLSNFYLFAKEIDNRGATIVIKQDAHFKVKSLELKIENEGQLLIKSNGRFVSDSSVANNDGKIRMIDQAYFDTGFHCVNADSVQLEDNSYFKVRKNLINSGLIQNSSLIEIGQ